MQLFFQTLVNGIALGSIFALIALGFSIVYTVLRSFNFAHGDTYMVGIFVSYSLIHAGAPQLLALVVGLAASTACAMGVERIAYRRFRHSDPLMGVVAAVAIALIIRQLVIWYWHVDTKPYPQLFTSPFHVGGVTITKTQILTLVVAVGVTVAVTLFLRLTRWGKAILLVRQDMEVASLMGVPVNRVVSVVYGVGGLIGGIGGYLFVTYYGVLSPNYGFEQTLSAFIAVVLGGIAGLEGALVGGLVLGLLEQFASAYVSSSYQMAIAFAVLVAFLLFRPFGIVGRQLKGQRV